MHRVVSSRRHRFSVRIGGQKVPRTRAVVITRAVFENEKTAILQMMLEGKVALVFIKDGMKVTSTFDGKYVLTRADGAVKMLEKGEYPEHFQMEVPEPVEEEKIFPEDGSTVEIIAEQEAEKAEEPTAAEVFEESIFEDEEPGLSDMPIEDVIDAKPVMVPAEEVEAAIEEEGGMDALLEKVNEEEPAEPHPGIVDYVEPEEEPEEEPAAEPALEEEPLPEPEEIQEEEPEPEVEEDPEPEPEKKPKRTRCAHPKCRKLAKPGESFCTKHAKEK
jgi:hypothetical protein